MRIRLLVMVAAAVGCGTAEEGGIEQSVSVIDGEHFEAEPEIAPPPRLVPVTVCEGDGFLSQPWWQPYSLWSLAGADEERRFFNPVRICNRTQPREPLQIQIGAGPPHAVVFDHLGCWELSGIAFDPQAYVRFGHSWSTVISYAGSGATVYLDNAPDVTLIPVDIAMAPYNFNEIEASDDSRREFCACFAGAGVGAAGCERFGIPPSRIAYNTERLSIDLWHAPSCIATTPSFGPGERTGSWEITCSYRCESADEPIRSYFSPACITLDGNSVSHNASWMATFAFGSMLNALDALQQILSYSFSVTVSDGRCNTAGVDAAAACQRMLGYAVARATGSILLALGAAATDIARWVLHSSQVTCTEHEEIVPLPVFAPLDPWDHRQPHDGPQTFVRIDAKYTFQCSARLVAPPPR